MKPFVNQTIYDAEVWIAVRNDASAVVNDYDEMRITSMLWMAIAKQKPIPVRAVRNAYGWSRYYCPCCNKEQAQRIDTKPMYCERCGQLLYVEKEENIEFTKNKN